MNKNFKAVKASLIMGILLVSLSAAFVPSSSAAGFGLLSPTPSLQFTYDPANTQNILPDNPTGSWIDLSVAYQIEGLLSKFAVNSYGPNRANVKAEIQFTIGAVPSYCNAYVQPQTTKARVAQSYTDGTADDQVRLHVSFTKDVPYMQSVSIPITATATVPSVFPFSISEKSKTITVTVTSAYLPIIDITPDPKYLETTPGGLATFGIQCDNKGNGETEFQFEIMDIPEGWSAQIVDQKMISANTKEPITLQVRGPIGFGYHDETQTLTIGVRGVYYAGGGVTTETYREITVTVRAVGFYASGFDAMVIILILVALVFVVFLFMRWRKKGK